MLEPETITPGDEAGNRMVVKYITPEGVVIYGIGVPQSWETPLGPTWSYVLEGEHLTLVDTGCNGGVGALEEGLEVIGYPLSAVDRIVVTHGHMDHDGSCLEVVARSGAQLWAHEIYGRLLNVNRWEREMGWRRAAKGFPEPGDTEFLKRIREHNQMSAQLSLDKVLQDGDSSEGLTFYHTPGHSPDELCILFQNVLFSGDHVLPQITPHPSVSVSYQSFEDVLPQEYRGENRCYGLRAFLTSLRKVEALGKDISVLPAHRAVHRGRFNLIGLERAGEILEHHRTRCHQFLELVRLGPVSMPDLTRQHFAHVDLDGINFVLAYTEALSHVEFLQECGDVAMVGEDKDLVSWNGTENFSGVIDQL